jgi:tetratricopeptide (TPR) repeat protein
VFFVADRYRLPLLIPLCAGAGAVLDALLRTISARRWTSLAIAGAAFAALFVWVNRPLHLDDGVGEERTRMAERLITLGRYGEAEQWAARAEEAAARPGITHFRLGQRLLVRGQRDAAVSHFEKALRFDPGRPEVEYVLGETLLDAQRADEAIPHLRRAFEGGVHIDGAGFDLVRALGATGHRDEAIDVLRTVRPAKDDDAERWVQLGELGMQLRDASLAETFFRRAIGVRPDFGPAHLGLAAASATFGRLPEARVQAQEALRLNPNDERAKQLLQTLK